MKTYYTLFAALAFSAFSLGITEAQTQTNNLTINLKDKKSDISPDMWGLFFEDINFAADGGLYAEMIKNYSFEFPSPFMGWRRVQQDGAEGYHFIEGHSSEGKNQKFLRLQRLNDSGTFGMQNDGFGGWPSKKVKIID